MQVDEALHPLFLLAQMAQPFGGINQVRAVQNQMRRQDVPKSNAQTTRSEIKYKHNTVRNQRQQQDVPSRSCAVSWYAAATEVLTGRVMALPHGDLLRRRLVLSGSSIPTNTC